MDVSKDIGEPIIKAFEGCLKPVASRPGFFTTYYCPAGELTIGWGHTNLGGDPPKIAPLDVWSKEQCDTVLTTDLKRYSARVARAFEGTILTQNQFDAFVSFDYNTGAIDKTSAVAKWKTGDRQGALDTLERWNKGGGKVLPGLVRRRKAERYLVEDKVAFALETAGTVRAEQPMAQRVDKPVPTMNDAIRNSPVASGAASAGATMTAASATSKPGAPVLGTGVPFEIALAGGVALLILAAFVTAEIRKHLSVNWA